MEQEWYDNVRNGGQYLCDRCNETVNIENFVNNRNNRGVYCDGCWNWIHLKGYKCNTCGSTGTLRSEKLPIKMCCGREVTWQK